MRKIVSLFLMLFFCSNVVYSTSIAQKLTENNITTKEDILIKSYFNECKGKQDCSYIEGGLANSTNFIILHYTVCESYEDTKKAYYSGGVSAHFTTDENGVIYQNVKTKDKALHAGVSKFGRFEKLNQYSIGIENVNPGFFDNQEILGYNNSERKWGSTYEFSSYPGIHWLEFSEKQFVATSTLVRNLQEEFSIPAYNVLTHADIAIDRKSDIGPMWDYKKSSIEYNAGFFYKNRQPNLDSFSCLEDKHYIELIKIFGYRFDDNYIKEGIRAFQMHYGWYNHRVKEKDISGELTDITKFSIINYAIGISAYKENKKDIMDFLEKEKIYTPFGEFF